MVLEVVRQLDGEKAEEKSSSLPWGNLVRAAPNNVFVMIPNITISYRNLPVKNNLFISDINSRSILYDLSSHLDRYTNINLPVNKIKQLCFKISIYLIQ